MDALLVRVTLQDKKGNECDFTGQEIAKMVIESDVYQSQKATKLNGDIVREYLEKEEIKIVGQYIFPVTYVLGLAISEVINPTITVKKK